MYTRFIFKPLTHHHTNFDWLLPCELILIGQDVSEEISTGSFRDVMLCCRETEHSVDIGSIFKTFWMRELHVLTGLAIHYYLRSIYLVRKSYT